MDVEAKVLLDEMTSVKDISSDGFKLFSGFIGDSYIILGVSGIGVINATMMSFYAGYEFKPSYVVNYGIAGGHSKDIHVGDLVIGNECININSYVTSKCLEGEGVNPLSWDIVDFTTNQLKIYKSDDKLVELALNLSDSYKDGNVWYGRIGSGDIWNREVDRIMYLNKEYNTLCEDMESISVYSVGDKFNIPVISMKIISNNEVNNEEYDRESICRFREFGKTYLKKLTKIRK